MNMGILLKIVATQLVVLVASLFLASNTPLGDKIIEWFGNYRRGLNVVFGIQIIGILITALIVVWNM